MLTCLNLVLLLVVAGCNRDSDGDRRRRLPSAVGQRHPQRWDEATSPSPPHLSTVVLIETSLGNITVRLDAENASLTVDNFLSYVGAKHHDQTIVHQVSRAKGFGGAMARTCRKAWPHAGPQ